MSEGLCTHAEISRIKCWPTFLNQTSSSWLTEGAGLHTVQKKTKYIFSWQWRHNFKWGKKETGLEEAESTGERKILILFLTAFFWNCLVFLWERNYVNVDNGNIIIPPEFILCNSEIHVWELSNELLSFFTKLSSIDRKLVLAKYCPLKYTDSIQNWIFYNLNWNIRM